MDYSWRPLGGCWRVPVSVPKPAVFQLRHEVIDIYASILKALGEVGFGEVLGYNPNTATGRYRMDLAYDLLRRRFHFGCRLVSNQASFLRRLAQLCAVALGRVLLGQSRLPVRGVPPLGHHRKSHL